MVEYYSFRKHLRNLSRATTAVLVGLSVVIAGCTTMKSVEMSSDELRAAVRAGEFGQPGQQMMAVTADGERHAFAFQGVDTTLDVVRGEGAAGEAVAVPIGDIVALRMETRDGVGTTGVVIGVGAALLLVLAFGYDFAGDMVNAVFSIFR